MFWRQFKQYPFFCLLSKKTIIREILVRIMCPWKQYVCSITICRKYILAYTSSKYKGGKAF